MRELKFRAWNESRKEYCYSGSWDHLSAFFAVHEQVCIFEQFTGIFDNNCIEIYDGDILQFVNAPGMGDSTVLVVWHQEQAAWFIENDLENVWDTIYNITGYCKVIGNIHENPEVLQE